MHSTMYYRSYCRSSWYRNNFFYLSDWCWTGNLDGENRGVEKGGQVCSCSFSCSNSCLSGISSCPCVRFLLLIIPVAEVRKEEIMLVKERRVMEEEELLSALLSSAEAPGVPHSPTEGMGGSLLVLETEEPHKSPHNRRLTVVIKAKVWSIFRISSLHWRLIPILLHAYLIPLFRLAPRQWALSWWPWWTHRRCLSTSLWTLVLWRWGGSEWTTWLRWGRGILFISYIINNIFTK